MKIWQKIYVFSLLLLMLVLNMGGVILIQNAHNNLLGKEVEKCIDEQKNISADLEANDILLQERESWDKHSYAKRKPVQSLVSEYIESNNTINGYDKCLEILNLHNKVIYRNIKIPIPKKRDEINLYSCRTQNYIIRTLKEKQYLFISSIIMLKHTNYKISYIKDISNVYAERTKYYTFFIKLDIFISVIFAICMFFISKLITKPINCLIESTKRISQGDYSENSVS
jgi:methyl-accepting chemotaxis protein